MIKIDRKKSFTGIATFVFVVIALSTLVLIVSVTDCFSLVSEPEDIHKLVKNVSMKITSPDWEVEYLNIDTNNATTADFLFECADVYDFDVEAQFWTGYDSYYISSINGIKEGIDGLFWQYYVNGKYADVGCSKYALNDNDFVEWKFAPSVWG